MSSSNTPSPPPPPHAPNLTLSIHPNEANRVVEASAVYATALREVQTDVTQAERLVYAAKRVLQCSQEGANFKRHESRTYDFLAQYIRTYRQFMPVPVEGIGMLLFCADMDKSTKLMHAFEFIQGHFRTVQKNSKKSTGAEDDSCFIHASDLNGDSISSNINDNDTEEDVLFADIIMSDDMENQSGLANGVLDENVTDNNHNSNCSNENNALELSQDQMEVLFQCILLSIACASEHGTVKENKLNEIQQVSRYAINKLFHDEFHKKKNNQNNINNTTTNNNTSMMKVSFEVFGEWYNYGGYNLVPWLELLDLRKWKQSSNHDVNHNNTTEHISSSLYHSHKKESKNSKTIIRKSSQRSVVSFDFSGTMPNNEMLHVNITEENLYILQSFVESTNLDTMSMDDVVCKIINSDHCHDSHSQHHSASNGSTTRVMSRQGFVQCILHEVCSLSTNNHNSSTSELQLYRHMLEGLYSCFDLNDTDAVNCVELAIGFTFLCNGNKSTKLARAFDLIDTHKRGRLDYRQLTRYLRSYLAILVGLSLSTYEYEDITREKSITRQGMYCAIHNGSEWTTSHVLSTCCDNNHHSSSNASSNSISFESFAKWYTDGGFNIAPWLELLDLKKFLNLLNVQQSPPISGTSASVTSGNTSCNTDSPSACTMNSFVQRHSMSMDSVAFSLPLAKGNQLVVLKDDVIYVRKVVQQLGLVPAKVAPGIVWDDMKRRLPQSGTYDQRTFIDVVSKVLSHRTSAVIDSELQFILQNFFSSFDLNECGNVSGNELMGGLSLLCDGRKSHKLAFAFSLFSSVDKNGSNCVLDSDTLFYFLRSILIVLFSCCAQSLELTAEQVSSWITDTAKMSCRDVMHHQWQNNHKKTVDFKEFGDWYNAGGHETAPWLELLDLGKWALNEELAPSHPHANKTNFSTSAHGIGNDAFNGLMLDNKEQTGTQDQPVKFQLITRRDSNGVFVSINAERVARLRQLVSESNLFNLDAKTVIDHLLSHCSTRGVLSKAEFDSCMRRIIRGDSLSLDAKNGLSELLHSVFYSFERGVTSSRMGPASTHEVSVYELACGFSVLCGGKKSDKLECTFDLFDHDHDGKLVRSELHRFLRSFITLFICLSSTTSDKNIYDEIDSAASWAADKIYESHHRNGPYISFDDFAQWYSDGGFSSIPWLELLDLRKWVLAEN